MDLRRSWFRRSGNDGADRRFPFGRKHGNRHIQSNVEHGADHACYRVDYDQQWQRQLIRQAERTQYPVSGASPATPATPIVANEAIIEKADTKTR